MAAGKVEDACRRGEIVTAGAEGPLDALQCGASNRKVSLLVVAEHTVVRRDRSIDL